LIKFKQKWSEQEVVRYVLRSTNVLILLGIRNNHHSGGRNLLFFLFIEKETKTDCNTYRGISLLPTAYKILSSILVSRLTLYTDEITRGNQCGFWHNKSTTNQIFCTQQVLEKKWEYNETVYQLFIDFKKAYDSVRREVLYNVLKLVYPWN